MNSNIYCYASGHVEIVPVGKEPPKGVLPIRLNATKKQVETITALCRLSYDGKTLLVPGIPEAMKKPRISDDEKMAEAYEAYKVFLERVRYACDKNSPPPKPRKKRKNRL